MTQTSLVHAADYADALLTARRAKTTLFVLLLLALLIELSLFFVARYTKVLGVLADTNDPNARYREILQYAVGLIDYIGIIAPAVLSIVLLLVAGIMLVGRLLGVAKTISAFVWSIALALLLFPWQAVLNNPAINSDLAANALGLKIPGVLYTWAEISHPIVGAAFTTGDPLFATLKWARFVGFPVLAIIMLIIIQTRSDRGLRQALGAGEIVIETTPVV